VSDSNQQITGEQTGETALPAEQEGRRERKKMSFGFAALNGSYWFATCFSMYLSAFLVSNGWHSTQVGILNSINNLIGAFSTPFWGAWSDKIRSVKKILIVLIITSAMTFGLVPFMDWKIAGVSLLFIVIPVATFFMRPMGSLVDNWMVRGCNKFGLHFGAIRCTGSITFGIVGLSLGFLVPKINEASPSGNLGTRLTFSFYSLALMLLLIAVLTLKESTFETGKKKQSLKEMQFGKLFKNYYYITYLVYAIIIQVPLACVNSFFAFLLEEINVDVAMIGYVQGTKAFIEIPMLLLMDRIRNKCPLYYLLIASGFLYMIEAFAYSSATAFIHIMFICLLQGLAGGLHIAAGSNYVNTLAPSNLKATAQTLNGSMVSFAGILGNAVGGVVIEYVGVRAFYRVSSFVLLGALILYMLSFPIGEKVLHIPRPKIVKHGVGVK